MASTVITPQAQALYQLHNSQSSEISSNSREGVRGSDDSNKQSSITETKSITSIANDNEHHDGFGDGNADMRKRQRGEYTTAEADEPKDVVNLSSIPAELIHLTLLNLLPSPTEHDTQTLSIDPRPNPTVEAELRHSLASLSKVNRVFHEQVKPLLWKDVRVENGRAWMGVVEGLVPQSQYPEHHGHLHPHGHGHAQAPDVSLNQHHHSTTTPHLGASSHIHEAHPHASPCIPAEPLPMLLPEEVSNDVPLRPNELTFSVAVAPVPEPVACGSCGIDMPQGPVSLSFARNGEASAAGTGLGLDTGLGTGAPLMPLSPMLPVDRAPTNAANGSATCDSCVNSPPQQTQPLLESPTLAMGSAASSGPSPRRPSFAALPPSIEHIHLHMPDTPHSTPAYVPTPNAAIFPATAEGTHAPPSTVMSRPVISIPQRMNPYLPSLLTPPSSRRSSPARWNRANSSSRSRSRSRSQSFSRASRSPSPPPVSGAAARSNVRPGLARAPSSLRRSISPDTPVFGSGFMRRRMSGSRMRSTSPVGGVVLPLASIHDTEVEAQDKKPGPSRKLSLRRGRGTDVGFAGYGAEAFTAGIMQRLDAVVRNDSADAPVAEDGAIEQDYFNYYDREQDLTLSSAADDALRVQDLKRALDEEVALMEGVETHDAMDVVAEVEGKGKGKEGFLQPDVDQEKVEGEWFDGIAPEEGR